MSKITKQIRIRKDYFLRGYYSIHNTKYRDGKMSYESLIGYTKSKKKAQLIKTKFMRSHQNE